MKSTWKQKFKFLAYYVVIFMAIKFSLEYLITHFAKNIILYDDPSTIKSFILIFIASFLTYLTIYFIDKLTKRKILIYKETEESRESHS